MEIIVLNFADISESCNNCTIVACDYAPKKSIVCDVFANFQSQLIREYGCDSVESPIGAIIAQQSSNCCAIISGVCNSRATEINVKVSGILLYMPLLAELHDSCTTIAQQLSNVRAIVAPQSLLGEITIS